MFSHQAVWKCCAIFYEFLDRVQSRLLICRRELRVAKGRCPMTWLDAWMVGGLIVLVVLIVLRKKGR